MSKGLSIWVDLSPVVSLIVIIQEDKLFNGIDIVLEERMASDGMCSDTIHCNPFVCASINEIPSPSNNDGSINKSNML